MVQTVVDVCCIDEHADNMDSGCCEPISNEENTCCSEIEKDHDNCDIQNIYLITPKYLEQSESLSFSDYAIDLTYRHLSIESIGEGHYSNPINPPPLISGRYQSIHCVWVI